MNKLTKIALSATSLSALCLSALIVHAGGWDNFKLRYFHLTQHLHEQDKEFQDLHKQDIDLEANSRVDLAAILNGGPPKDGIPSIDAPKFDTATTTKFPSSETVIGVVINGEAKAYPFGIMNWHELVNDTVGEVNVSVSYCPLCDTIVAFERGETTFGVSGKLYQSCLVMYDRGDDTLYSQPWAMGLVGAKVNQNLKRIPAVKTTLGAWLAKYPDSKILSQDTGYGRNYQRYPYGSYYTDEEIIFPVRNQESRQLHPKKIVSYIWEANQKTPKNYFSGSHHQFVHEEMKEMGEKVVEFEGREVKAKWDRELETVLVEEMDGTPIPSTTAFAFVYSAYFGNK